MKICLYLEFYRFLGGFLYKKIGTGLLSSYANQKIILNRINVPFTEQWNDSCDILQINTPWLRSLLLIKKVKAKGKKVIIWSHVTAEDAREVFRINKLIAPLIRAYLKYAYGKADMVFSPSEYTKSLLIGYGLKPEKITVMSNGVDLEKFYADIQKCERGRKEYALSGTVIGTVGLAIPRKGIDTFLLLAERFPSLRFMWYGKIYNSLFTKPLPEHIPQNATFTGYVKDILAAFNSLDIFIFPSYEENQGMVILEAAALGLPILVRDIPVYNPWLVHNKNCLKAKNNDEFETYIKMLVEDGELRKRLGENAKLLAQDESLERIAAKSMAVYQALLKGN